MAVTRPILAALLLLATPALAQQDGGLTPQIAAPYVPRPDDGGAPQPAAHESPERTESYTGYVPLKDYIDLRFDELRRELILRFQSSELAINKAEQATAIHFASINGLNERLERQASQLVSAETFQTAILAARIEREAISERTKAIELKLERQEGAASVGTVLWGMGATLLLAILAAFAIRFMGSRVETVAVRK